MRQRLLRTCVLGLVILMVLGSCGTPWVRPSGELSLEATQIALHALQTAIVITTQEAALTQSALNQAHLPLVSGGEPSFTPALPPAPTAIPTSIPTIVRTPTLDLSGLVTLTPVGVCNAASTGQPFDITIPDGSLLLPGQKFEKVWRLVNSGTCTWNRLYKLVFYSQNSMDAYQEQLFGGEVQPGQAVDLKVQFTAPMEPGEYQSNWMLMDGEGNLFGVGTWADSPFWVNIRVVEELPPDATPIN